MTLASLTEESISDESEPPSPWQVLVVNETDAAIDAARLEAAVRAVISELAHTSIVVSVAVVDDETIHELNRRFLDHDYATDVLSFALSDQQSRLEGEIVVSRETAERAAKEVGWSAADELLLYVVHGALHLAGYGDTTAEEEAEMRVQERKALAKLGVAPSPKDGRWAASAREEAPS
jgi:probable rRNA maturation factor